MKKMTKIESARIIVKRKGDCRGIKCLDCFRVNFCDNDEIEIDDRLKNQFADAEAYIKRHESKSKKKDHILDTTKKVEEPCVKDCPANSEIPQPMFVRMTARSEGKTFERAMEIWADKFQNNEIKINWVDKEPQPIPLDNLRKMMYKEGYIYYFDRDEHIGRLNMKYVHEILIDGGMITMKLIEKVTANNYYRTLEEAVIVAKKLWNGEGK